MALCDMNEPSISAHHNRVRAWARKSCRGFYSLRSQDAEVNESLETFRFWDKNDYEYEIFSIVSSARAWAS